ncbi:DUF115 domain-containing protein [Arthrobacter sp. BHU FT2]|nr:DUF115 domain-containing protein [Arthrobacter sp. BHU FT2]
MMIGVSSQAREGASALRRAATAVLGDDGARRLAARKTDLDALLVNNLTSAGRNNKSQIQQLEGKHLGERCVIIGNGPSLNKTNLELLRNETTFGLNRIYLMFEKLGFSTTYHAVVNQLVVEQCAEDFARLSAPLFTTLPSRRFLNEREETFFLNKLVGPRFSANLTHGIWEGATVTYVAMQVAYYMGFSEVVLVGVDHNFVSKGPAHKEVESAGADPNHFDPNYFGKGFKWQLPDLETSEVAYTLANEAFAARGGSIVDATVDGKLQIFPKVALEDVLK